MDNILKQIKEFEVYNVVSRIHQNEDIELGDLTERLEENQFYNHVCNYPISKLSLNQYDLDEDKIEDIIYEIEEKGISSMPKIIIDSNNDFIDGLHRANALNRLGYKEIDLLIGTNKKFTPTYEKELVDEELQIYKISNKFGSISIMENAKYSPADNSVSEFIVNEKYRGLGVGTELLKEAMNQYDNLGAQVSSVASMKVFLECGFKPFDLNDSGSFDLDCTSYDFKTFNKDSELLNGQAAMYRNSIQVFQNRMSESKKLFDNNDGSLFFEDQREKVSLKNELKKESRSNKKRRRP